jgi:putative PEP-CTERM system TPR-repeat lipoprotein
MLMAEYQRVLDEIQASEQTSQANLARIYQLRADALLKQGKVKDACGLYQQSLEINAQNPATYWGLAQCAVVERNPAKAREWLATALKLKDRQAKSWIYSGELELLDKNSDAALTAYTNALNLEPDNLEALRSRAALNIGLNQMGPAQADIEKIHKLAPNSFVAHYMLALLKFTEEKLPEARNALQNALKLAPENIPAQILGGSIEYALGNLQIAESYLNKAVRAAPRNAYARRMLAATQLRLGRPDDAEKTFAPFDMEKVTDASILAVAGEIALAKMDYSKAAAFFEKAAEIKPEDAAIRTELGLIRLAQGDERAMADFQAATRMASDNYRADTVIILTQLKQAQFDAALTSIAALEKKQGPTPLSMNYRGAAHLGKKDVANARSSFEQALKLDPKFFPAAAALAKLDLDENKTTRARARFEGVLKAEANHLQAMLAMANLSLLDKDEKAYLRWLEKAAKAHPQALPPREAIIRYQLSKREMKKALDTARDVVHANPNNVDALIMLSATQLAAGENTQAIDTLTRLTQRSNQSTDAFLLLAHAQIADKQPQAARDSLKKALQFKPDFLRAQDALLRLEVEAGKPEAALQIARQIQTLHPKNPIGFEREADILMTQKNFPQAAKAYEEALLKGTGPAGLIKLHRALYAAGNTGTADKRLTEWVRQYPKDTALHTYAAEVYMQTNRSREAIVQYEALLKISPDNAIALNNLANLYQRAKDGRAMSAAEQAYKLAPDHPAIQDTLGWILVEQGELQRGLELLSKAATKLPKVGTVRYHYGAALARAGKEADARKELETAIALGQKFPELEEARRLLRTL